MTLTELINTLKTYEKVNGNNAVTCDFINLDYDWWETKDVVDLRLEPNPDGSIRIDLLE